ncbi:MAG TPA: GNAT family protein [Pyrinomonadaceae bacterium]|nr:GNAT family protein [Pyrinomonadaceae bacterium]
MNFWQGKKIRLRGIELSDAEYFIRWNLNSERARHLDFVWPPTSNASVHAWVEEQSKRKLENDSFHWVIENHDSEIVGSISTHDCNPRAGTFSYGIDIAPEHHRKGCASEAIQLVMQYYFEELRYQKVTVPVHGDNESSIRLHEKLGFQREGTHRRMVYTQGHFVDVLWFGMTVEEFHRKLSPSNNAG